MADTAQDLLKEMLGSILPPGLLDQAFQMVLDGASASEILTWARTTPEYKVKYPGIEELRKDGSPLGAEGNYNQYVQQAKEMAHAYGLPPSVYDQPDDFVESMKGGTSISELQDRFQMAASAAYTMPQEIRDALRDTYGVTAGGLIGYYLDADRAIPTLQRQFQAAQVIGAGAMSGVATSQQQAERLAERGVTMEQAQQGFQQVASLAGLGSALGAGETIDQSSLTDAVLGGDTEAQRRAKRVQQSRAAQFGESGGAAAGQQGVGGLAASRTT